MTSQQDDSRLQGEHIDDKGTGDTNTGDTNTGETNTGETNTGETNTGETNTESATFYVRLKTLVTKKAHPPLSRDAKKRLKNAQEHGSNTPFSPGRDPLALGSALGGLTQELGWESTLSQAEVLVNWPQIVGPDISAHTEADEISDGTLIVRCESTAWATQLRLIRADILTKILEAHPQADVTAIRFRGPDAPSWKRGPKSIPGRGPRDTYG